MCSNLYHFGVFVPKQTNCCRERVVLFSLSVDSVFRASYVPWRQSPTSHENGSRFLCRLCKCSLQGLCLFCPLCLLPKRTPKASSPSPRFSRRAAPPAGSALKLVPFSIIESAFVASDSVHSPPLKGRRPPRCATPLKVECTCALTARVVASPGGTLAGRPSRPRA